MHTPIEEQGLRARRLQTRVGHALARLSPAEFQAVSAAVEEQSRRRQITYVRDDREEVIPVFSVPVVLTAEQYAYAHSAALTLLSALKRLPALYQSDPDVREVLRLPEEEERWFLEGTAERRRHDPVFARLDAICDWATPHWRDTLQFVEPNLSGVGGLHLLPAAERMFAEVVLPHLAAEHTRLHMLPDIRELLMQEMVDHLEALGRPGRHVTLIEPGERTPGPEEQEELARHFRARYGLTVSHADPRDLRIDNGEVMHGDKVVDIAYRDYAVIDLLPLQRQGVDLQPMKTLLMQNRMISSITADIDAKANFEVFSDEKLLLRHFSPDEVDVLARHVLWTRRVSERSTMSPAGHEIDLVPFIRSHKDDLVLKPNRSYGGYGVLVGPAVDDAAWERAIDEAVRAPGSFVVQQRAAIPVLDLPVWQADRFQLEPFYVVLGLAPSRYGLAVLGRASQQQVVNVAQRGGIVPLLVAEQGG